MTKVSLNLIVIRSNDSERAVQFYSLLGLTFAHHQHGNGLPHVAAQSGSLTFEIVPRKDGTDSTAAVRLGFQVACLDAVMGRLQNAGAKIVQAPKMSPWGRRAVVDDPDGHRIELTESIGS